MHYVSNRERNWVFAIETKSTLHRHVQAICNIISAK